MDSASNSLIRLHEEKKRVSSPIYEPAWEKRMGKRTHASLLSLKAFCACLFCSALLSELTFLAFFSLAARSRSSADRLYGFGGAGARADVPEPEATGGGGRDGSG